MFGVFFPFDFSKLFDLLLMANYPVHLCFKATVQGQQKLATCFVTLLQNELKSGVVRFTTSNHLFCNK